MPGEESSAAKWITSTPSVLDGKPRVKNRRLGVYFLATQVVDGGDEPEAVADRYTVPVEAVRAAVSYYYAHPDEMAAIEQRRTQILQEAHADPSVPTTPQELANFASGARSTSD